MDSVLAFFVALAVSIPLAEVLRRRFNARGTVIYVWPSRRLREFIEAHAHSANWQLFGDFAVVLLAGPLLSRRFASDRRAYVLFALYVLVTMVAIPFFGGAATFRSIDFLALGVVLLTGYAGYAMLLIAQSAWGIIYSYFHGVTPAPGIGPAIPGVDIGGFEIPLWQGIVALAIALIFHEGAHGVVALRERVPLEESGFITLGLLPIGAYVEPKEGIFKARPPLSKLRVFAAGPAANMIIFAVFAALMLALAPVGSFLTDYGCAHGKGVRILSVPKTFQIGTDVVPSGAYGKIPAGAVVLDVNGEPIRCTYQFMLAMARYQKLDYNGPAYFTIDVNGQIRTVQVTLHRGFMGIRGVETVYAEPLPWWYDALTFLLSVVSWVALLNLMVGLVNMLPLDPLDGGQFYRVFFEGGKVYELLQWLTILLFVLNALPWFFK